MNLEAFIFREGTATEDAIHAHLQACSQDFIPPLETRVCIKSYAKKLHERAVTFEAWSGDQLVGLIAAYFSTAAPPGPVVFISSVSVLNSYASKGIGSSLLRLCIEKARSEHAESIELEVASEHQRAVQLYSKHGFRVSGIKCTSTRMNLQLNEQIEL